MASRLEQAQLHTFRGPAHILHGLSLSVQEREVVCLVGRNGAGKTTTIESIMGLLPLRSGAIILQGQDITRLPPTSAPVLAWAMRRRARRFSQS